MAFRGCAPKTLWCHVASQKNRDIAARTFKNIKKFRRKRGKWWDFIVKGLLFATDKHTAHETAIRHNPHISSNWDSTLLDSWVTNTTSVKMLCPQHSCFFLYFHKKHNVLDCWSIEKGQVFSVSCKTVYLWVTTICCVMNDKLPCHVPGVIIFQLWQSSISEYYLYCKRSLLITKLATNKSQLLWTHNYLNFLIWLKFKKLLPLSSSRLFFYG